MSQTESLTEETTTTTLSDRPELNEEDYNAPFLHETTSKNQVLYVVFTMVLTILLTGLAIYLA